MNELVKYNNDLNLAQFNGLSAIGQDMFFALVSRMRDKGTEVVILTYSQMRELTNFPKTLSDTEFSKELKKASRIVRSADCSIPTEGGGFIDFNLFPTFIADPATKTVKIRVNQDFAYMLNEFTHFTSFELSQFIHLQSKYTKTLFRKLKQFKSTGFYRVDMDEFRRIMAIPKSYTSRQIRARVINPSVTELSKDFKGLVCKPYFLPKPGAPIGGYEFRFQAEGQIPGQMSIDDLQPSQKSRKKPKNSFCDFQQNTYDFNALEADIVRNNTPKTHHGTMTEEQKAEYDRLTANAEQMELPGTEQQAKEPETKYETNEKVYPVDFGDGDIRYMTKAQIDEYNHSHWRKELPEYYVVEGDPDMVTKALDLGSKGIRSVAVLTKAEYEYLKNKCNR
jgi:plasmid replication initiation protein